MSLFVLLLFGIGLVVVAVTLGGRRAPGRVAQPSCGRCGYAVEGLETLRCPECGGDFRAVGIRTPEMTGLTPQTRVKLLVLAWTIIVPTLAVPLAGLVDRSLPRRFANTVTITLQPAPNADLGARLTFTGISPERQGGYDEVEVTLGRVGGAAPPLALVASLDDDSCRMRAADGSWQDLEGVIGPAAVTRWLGAAGLAMDEALNVDRAGTIARLMGGSPQTSMGRPLRGFTAMHRSSTSPRVRRVWFVPAAVVLSTLTWLLGLKLIVRRGGRPDA
jgi:hypothetical protein